VLALYHTLRIIAILFLKIARNLPFYSILTLG